MSQTHDDSSILSYFDELISPLFELPNVLPPSTWQGHIPFLFALFSNLKPKSYVELGVFAGASLLAAASASERYKSETRCVGVDSWESDIHSGPYDGPKILESVQQNIASNGLNVTLIQSFFDDARPRIEDHSVDILHIDGLHTYDAVRHDFENWFGALSKRGVVLFHDISVFERDFGVWKLWRELSDQYPTIEFHHSYGLGVLFVSPLEDIPPALRLLTKDAGALKFYRALVEKVAASIAVRFGPSQSIDLASPDADETLARHLRLEAELSYRASKAETELERLYASKSWRLTSPLRRAYGLVRR